MKLLKPLSEVVGDIDRDFCHSGLGVEGLV
jgi:hypothetical protein